MDQKHILLESLTLKEGLCCLKHPELRVAIQKVNNWISITTLERSHNQE